MKIVQVMLMYMSAVPVVLTLRTSTVLQDNQEELDIHRSDKHGRPPGHLVQAWRWLQRRNFLLRQASIVFVLTVVIAIIQDAALRTNPDFTIFALLYEVISGYGNVGFSLGYVNTTTSFSAVWSPAAKVLLGVLMLVGRHRGMPHEFDSSVMFISRDRDSTHVAESYRQVAARGLSSLRPTGPFAATVSAFESALSAHSTDPATTIATGASASVCPSVDGVPTAGSEHAVAVSEGAAAVAASSDGDRSEVVVEHALDSEGVPRRRLVVRRLSSEHKTMMEV
jgi:hypothetical protein